jgi:hypothetical protein
LLRIEPRRHRLEDLFRDAPATSGGAIPVVGPPA